MRLDLEKLQVFVAVARAGSHAAAARELHVTPSAISHALRKLQDSLDRELWEWRGRKLQLTEHGEQLLQACGPAFDQLEEVERLLTRGGEPDRSLVLGCTIEFGTTLLLAKLRPLLDAEPSLQIDFHFSNDLHRPLLRDEIDLAVDCRPHLHPAIHRTPMFREKYVAIATPAFLARYPVRTPIDLRRTPVLSLDREGTWWNNLLRALPGRRRPELERIIVVDHVRGMINGTLAGYGVSLVPKYSVLREVAAGALTVLFPRLQLGEDTFSIFQKLARVERPANRLVTRHLLGIDVRELGDALAGGRQFTSARSRT
jgi:DNA-binding transcriptional LysR family regulator